MLSTSPPSSKYFFLVPLINASRKNSIADIWHIFGAFLLFKRASHIRCGTSHTVVYVRISHNPLKHHRSFEYAFVVDALAVVRRLPPLWRHVNRVLCAIYALSLTQMWAHCARIAVTKINLTLKCGCKHKKQCRYNPTRWRKTRNRFPGHISMSQKIIQHK